MTLPANRIEFKQIGKVKLLSPVVNGEVIKLLLDKDEAAQVADMVVDFMGIVEKRYFKMVVSGACKIAMRG